MAKYTADGHHELPDPTPVEIPIGYKAPETLQQMIARMVQSEALKAELQRQGAETFEESDDFEVEGDEGEMVSPYEMRDMEPEFVAQREEKPKEVGKEAAAPAEESTVKT